MATASAAWIARSDQGAPKARGRRVRARPMSPSVMSASRIAPFIGPHSSDKQIADDPRPDPFRRKVNQHDDDQNKDGDRAHLLVDVEADHPFEFLADPAGADKADDRRGPHVYLEAQQSVAEETGQHLR